MNFKIVNANHKILKIDVLKPYNYSISIEIVLYQSIIKMLYYVHVCYIFILMNLNNITSRVAVSLLNLI